MSAQHRSRIFEKGDWQFKVARKSEVDTTQLDSYFNLVVSGEFDSGKFETTFQAPEEQRVRLSRGSTYRVSIAEHSLVVRKYYRGGLLRHFNKDLHFALGVEPRPFREMDLLDNLVEEGFATTKPVFAAIRKVFAGSFYQGYLATKELENHSNFLSMIVHSKKKNDKLAHAAGLAADELLKQGVLHRDLHPGNVLVDNETGGVAIIDFDGFGLTELAGSESDRSYLVERWARSIRKHQLNPVLIENFKSGLESNGCS